MAAFNIILTELTICNFHNLANILSFCNKSSNIPAYILSEIAQHKEDMRQMKTLVQIIKLAGMATTEFIIWFADKLKGGK